MIKLNNLRLGQKFTLLLVLVFLAGIVASGVALSTVLNRSAQAQVTTKALMLMETMNSVREYTSSQVQPELEARLASEFLPETVPAYSAREVFETFRANPAYGDFFYKEATLNPTNLRDKADEFETVIVENFRAQDDPGEVSGFRTTPAGKLFYIARPIRIEQESCLQCHGSLEEAPASLIDRYGSANGFGWTLNEIVGAQVISVPAETVLQNARQSLLLTLGIFVVVFAIAIFLVNLWLKRFVVRPLNRMARVAEAVSTGDTDAEFNQTSNDEVGQLAQSFNRMRMSLQMAMRRLERYREGRRSSGNFSE
ncbi:uncharacterized protein XM38_048170 [Halomicronema hongdechloris C2206]|uniref:histidine kinase n=1 Tax=Halomicronema hongdechloris C2206 TaxID=1641165 RepID=A0A1Z3HU74_9CYAN|nr:DUF3365 domain-containing protein [Halomicronema hongdechloris]ASC73843.1 uncharacterized protein XM38_048170 [Halomicronema hongdechloris C2206]